VREREKRERKSERDGKRIYPTVRFKVAWFIFY
jgi:hypothetical protein